MGHRNHIETFPWHWDPSGGPATCIHEDRLPSLTTQSTIFFKYSDSQKRSWQFLGLSKTLQKHMFGWCWNIFFFILKDSGSKCKTAWFIPGIFNLLPILGLSVAANLKFLAPLWYWGREPENPRIFKSQGYFEFLFQFLIFLWYISCAKRPREDVGNCTTIHHGHPDCRISNSQNTIFSAADWLSWVGLGKFCQWEFGHTHQYEESSVKFSNTWEKGNILIKFDNFWIYPLNNGILICFCKTLRKFRIFFCENLDHFHGNFWRNLYHFHRGGFLRGLVTNQKKSFYICTESADVSGP